MENLEDRGRCLYLENTMSKIQMEDDSTVPGFFKESGKEKMIKEI